jgi:hypothetical protein
MVDVLPIFFLLAAGLSLTLCLFALWQSIAGVLSPGDAGHMLRREMNAPREALLHEKSELLHTLRELRSEHELGKISDADFHELDQRHRARAREVLRELDEEIEPLRAQARAMIEAALGAASTERVVAPSNGACGQCGTANDADAVFCKKCGTKLGGSAGARGPQEVGA